MTGGLLAAALTLLVWPDPGGGSRARLGPGTGRGRPARRLGVPRLPPPYLVAVSALAVTAVVSTPLVACLAAGAGFLACRAWLARRSTIRVDAQLAALGEGVGALAAELRSGRSIVAAADAAISAGGDRQCGRWLAAAVRAPDAAPAGAPPELVEALDRISAAVTLSTRTGCSLVGVVSAVEDDLRARRRHRLELQAATAGPRASALLLAALPVLGLAMGSGVGADPWQVLTQTAPGQVLLVVGAALELAGTAWSSGLVRRALR